MTPLFSVIIPTYERQAMLNEAIESVLVQTAPDLECIVVDDASYEPASVPGDDRIRLIRLGSNGGAAAARNAGLDAAIGRYVCFLDDDDVYAENRLASASTGLDSGPATVCWRSTTGAGSRMLIGDAHDSILDDFTPHLGQVTLERGVAPKFDETYLALEDVEWWLRVTAVLPLVTVPEVGYLVRSHAGERQTNGIDRRIECSLRLLREHRPYFETHPRAAAFRWMRIGAMAATVGDEHLARTAFFRSLVKRPAVRTAYRAARVLASMSQAPSASATGAVRSKHADG